MNSCQHRKWEYMDKYLSVADVAEILNLKTSTVYKLINHDDPDKKLIPLNPVSYRGEGGYRFSEAEIERIKPYYVKDKLSPSQAARKIGRSTTFIYQLIKKGLPYERAVYRGKETFLISPSDLEPYTHPANQHYSKFDLIYDKRTGVYLFQPYVLNGQIGRITHIKRLSRSKIEAQLCVGQEHILLSEALAEGWKPMTIAGGQRIISSYGYATFVFPHPAELDSIIYEVINLLFVLLGPLNLRIRSTQQSIYIEAKKSFLPITQTEIIKVLSRYVEKGEIIKKKDGVLIDTELSPVTFYLKGGKKAALQELARKDGLSLQVWLTDHFNQLLNEVE